MPHFFGNRNSDSSLGLERRSKQEGQEFPAMPAPCLLHAKKIVSLSQPKPAQKAVSSWLCGA
jgi:hypothetical protein